MEKKKTYMFKKVNADNEAIVLWDCHKAYAYQLKTPIPAFEANSLESITSTK